MPLSRLRESNVRIGRERGKPDMAPFVLASLASHGSTYKSGALPPPSCQLIDEPAYLVTEQSTSETGAPHWSARITLISVAQWSVLRCAAISARRSMQRPSNQHPFRSPGRKK